MDPLDNLDKGWPPRGLTTEDVLIIRCLLEAMGKIEKFLSMAGTACHGIVFLRNDVYELLVDSSSDRGKTSRVTIDWTDPELLRELLRRRLVSNGLDPDTPFDQIWQQICVSHVGGEESASYLIDRCLMRPRSLIELVQQCRSHAVNLGHAKIELQDIEEGESSYSNDLVINFGLEVRDVFPAAGDILYEFIGSTARLSEEEILQLFERAKIDRQIHGELLDLLLWFGFFGVVRESGDVVYIYSVQYDMKHLKAVLRKKEGRAVFFINPAFWAGLEITA